MLMSPPESPLTQRGGEGGGEGGGGGYAQPEEILDADALGKLGAKAMRKKEQCAGLGVGLGLGLGSGLGSGLGLGSGSGSGLGLRLGVRK